MNTCISSRFQTFILGIFSGFLLSHSVLWITSFTQKPSEFTDGHPISLSFPAYNGCQSSSFYFRIKDCSQTLANSVNNSARKSVVSLNENSDMVEKKSPHVHAAEEWSKNMKEDKRFWAKREAIVVKLLVSMYNKVSTEVFSVLDIGCGAMHLEKAFLSEKKTGRKRRFVYLPVDAFPRQDSRVMLCDLNSHEFPHLPSTKVSVIVLQGLLEYIYDKQLFFQTIRCLHPTTPVVFTYHLYEKVGYNKLWVTPMDSVVLEEIARQNGYKEEAKIQITDVNYLYKWIPNGIRNLSD